MNKEQTQYTNADSLPVYSGDIFQSCFVGDIFVVRKFVISPVKFTWLAVNLRTYEVHNLCDFRHYCIKPLGNCYEDYTLLNYEKLKELSKK